MKSLHHDEDGFTGLEAAIVLIAFVVVAAVFSYVVLGAGFFTTQKAQETVHTGVGQATSALQPSGPVTVETTAVANTVGNISFYLNLAAGGNPVDMNKVTYTISTTRKVQTVLAGDSGVFITWPKALQTPADNMLEAREMVLVDLDMETIGWGISDITANDKFLIEVKPPIGAALPISRTLPAAMTASTFYEVF
jgi:flagellin FlaB